MFKISLRTLPTRLLHNQFRPYLPTQSFTTTTSTKMPEALKSSEVHSQTDPSVAKQYDTKTSISEQFTDLYAIADANKIGMLTTHRASLGPVARSMAIAKRTGPDFLFLANTHSQKVADIAADPLVNVSLQDGSRQDWISITGTATTSNADPRIKEIYSKPIKAWFGDLGDGKHDGSAEDPRMTLIEVKAKCTSIPPCAARRQ